MAMEKIAERSGKQIKFVTDRCILVLNTGEFLPGLKKSNRL